MKSKLKFIIPDQESGKKNDLNSNFIAADQITARKCYTIARERLLNVNYWAEKGGKLSAEFVLTDESGLPVQRTAKEGDYIRIDVPGPGSKEGKGYDFVKIDTIAEESDGGSSDVIGMRVYPAKNPAGDQINTAHFFDEKASSTFIIRRNGNQVSAEYHGRNEVPNFSTDNLVDKVRNAAVALGGMLGLSEIQWKSLIEGFVSFDDISAT